MSYNLDKSKMLEKVKEYESQDGFTFAEYQVTGDLRKMILERVDADPTGFVTLQERTWEVEYEEGFMEETQVFVHVEAVGQDKNSVFVGTRSADHREVNKELWDWVLFDAKPE